MTPAEVRGRAFEWFVAWRHLRDPERRSHRILIVGLSLIALAVALFVAASMISSRLFEHEGFLRLRSSLILEGVRQGAAVVGGLGILFAFYGALRSASFSVFTAISILGVTLGTYLPIVTLSVMSGFETDLKTKIRGAKADVVISMADDQPFQDWAGVRKKIAGVPNLVGSTPFLDSEAIIRSGPAGFAINIRGIDPETAPSVLDLSRSLRDGKLDDLLHPERVGDVPLGRPYDPFGDPDRELSKGKEKSEAEKQPAPREVLPAIILGEDLYAHTLRVFIGSEVDVACAMCRIGPSGPRPGLSRFRVAGHFYSGMYEYDAKQAYASLAEVQRFLQMPGEVSGIDVRTRTPEDARAVATAVQKLLGPRYEVRSWEDLNKGLYGALEVEKIGMFVALAFILLVASFSIVATLIMSATQKAREVAIIKSMGASDWAVARVFVTEGLYIGLIGIAVGVSGGVGTCRLILKYGLRLPTDVYYISQLPVVMRAEEIVAIGLLALVLCFAATVYPAIVASRMRPVEGLKYE